MFALFSFAKAYRRTLNAFNILLFQEEWYIISPFFFVMIYSSTMFDLNVETSYSTHMKIYASNSQNFRRYILLIEPNIYFYYIYCYFMELLYYFFYYYFIKLFNFDPLFRKQFFVRINYV